ncbi:hypothetical protein CMQ_5494 [Grosmannia clavigera kw1407]|uniref:Uncharacterized protein n=1 Tax=Grosmannia clavigera (strain kw1407 / UAMH 11150) TaxID=655863 RepID=F0XT02_GROCL|nr:uncharacterized protein CMQ_5494 [Grosmannia clavigera kw1407]EFW99073.1 hypothetical protein CMQ_5494 [Grosmannia clavigera kw1407]
MYTYIFTAVVVSMLWASQAVAHLTLATPVPFGTPDNSPLSTSGSNFPCQIVGTAATFYDRSSATNNTMAVGETQTLSFKGSAVHGGGSCQLAVTSEQQPTSSTTWQVILSIEGGCPTTDGNGPSTYDYSIPDSISPGDYVFAWTWVSKESGAPEYYMNCAPITVTAASPGKRSEVKTTVAARDSSALPNLFVANLDSINSCKTTTGTDPLFPDPGPNVSKPSKMTTNYQSPAGTNCFPLGATDSSSSSTSAASPSTSGSSATASAVTVAADSSSSSTSTTLSTAVVATSSANAAAATTAATETATTTPATAAAATTSSVSASTQASGSTNGTPAAGSSLSGSCMSEGTFNCVGGSKYQQCASGSWTAFQAMPAGTKCQDGQSTTLWSRDRNMRRMRRVRRNL